MNMQKTQAFAAESLESDPRNGNFIKNSQNKVKSPNLPTRAKTIFATIFKIILFVYFEKYRLKYY